MQHSESLTKLATALAAVHGELENVTKNAVNPHFGKKYADLAGIINSTTPVLAKHGLSVVQIPGYADGVVTVDTMLLHTSGEWIQHTSGAPIGRMADAQGVGSATTYLRRYSLAAVCGIAQEDDDGTSAAATTRQEGAQGNGGGAPQPASDAQVKKIGVMYGQLRDLLPEQHREWAREQIADGFTKATAHKMIDWLTEAEAKYKPQEVGA